MKSLDLTETDFSFESNELRRGMIRARTKAAGVVISGLVATIILVALVLSFTSRERRIRVQVVDAQTENVISNVNVDLLQSEPWPASIRYLLKTIGRQSDVRVVARQFKSRTGTMDLHFVTSAVFTAVGYYGAELVHESGELEYTLMIGGSNGTRDLSFWGTNTVKVPLEPKNSRGK